MTDFDDNDDLDTDEQEQSQSRQVTLSRSAIRSLERDAKAFKESQAEMATLKRQLAFTSAGIKPDDPKMSYFVKGYDGELTADAITKAATEAGFLAPPVEQTDTEQELAAHDRVSAASAGTASRGKDADKVAKLRQAASGGRDALIAQLQADGRVIV